MSTADAKLLEVAKLLSGEMVTRVDDAKAAIAAGDIPRCVANLAAVESISSRLRAVLALCNAGEDALRQVDERAGEARAMRQLLEGYAQKRVATAEGN